MAGPVLVTNDLLCSTAVKFADARPKAAARRAAMSSFEL
jgi:hypothetical protein